MTTVYFLVWGASLAISAGIWFGLRLWFKHADRKPKMVASASPAGAPRPARGTQSWLGRSGRPDGGPFYMCMMFSLFSGGLIMAIGGPIHPSTIDAMSADVQRVMSLVLCLGTGTCIFGFTSGTRYFRPNADLRECYRLAVVATPSNVATLAVYAMAVGNTVHWNLQLFGLGAGGILAVMVAHLLMAWDLHHEIKKLDERIATAIDVAIRKAALRKNRGDDG